MLGHMSFEFSETKRQQAHGGVEVKFPKPAPWKSGTHAITWVYFERTAGADEHIHNRARSFGSLRPKAGDIGRNHRVFGRTGSDKHM